ncbi:hypothetical protein DY000_02039486 [Brassica cretica]|uniref:Uncharacterized protein n=1 Tax=Brassica cretica TaxID=69181 RepID=A0ABQ7B526_BRACR|nr:hypothetical protein DY000_02039486 [Brassica cretica]
MRVAPWLNAQLICPWFPRGRIFPWKYVEARSLGNLEKHVTLASFRSEQPKIRNLEAGIWNLESGTWNLEGGIWNLEDGIWNSQEVAQQCSPRLGRVPFVEQLQRNLTIKTRDQLDPRNVEAGFEVETWSRGEPNVIEGRFVAGTGSRQGPETVEVILVDYRDPVLVLASNYATTVSMVLYSLRGVFWDPSCASFRSDESRRCVSNSGGEWSLGRDCLFMVKAAGSSGSAIDGPDSRVGPWVPPDL